MYKYTKQFETYVTHTVHNYRLTHFTFAFMHTRLNALTFIYAYL